MEKWSSQRIRELMTPIALRGMAGNKIGCARISMMVRSMSSNTRPDTLMQDRTLQAYRFLLQRTAGPYIGVIHEMGDDTTLPLRGLGLKTRGKSEWMLTNDGWGQKR